MAAQLGARRLEMLMAQAVREMLEELSAPVVTFSTSASAARLRSSLAAIRSRSVFLTRTRLPGLIQAFPKSRRASIAVSS